MSHDSTEYPKALLYDDGEPTDEEKRCQLAALGRRSGWDGPEMDVYDQYDDCLRASLGLP